MIAVLGLLLLCVGIGISPIVHDPSTDVPTAGEWLAFVLMLGGSVILTIECLFWLFDALGGLL